MIAPPAALLTEFTQTLQTGRIATELQRHCLKWFRYYLDFCAKYQLHSGQAASLNPFLEMLKAKNQAVGQQAEAKRAVELFLQMGQAQGRVKRRVRLDKWVFSHPFNTHAPSL